jgi:membrane protease YdiL (CAAX protease family)
MASWVMMSRVESRAPAALGLVLGRRGLVDFFRGGAVGLILVGGVAGAMFVAGWLVPVPPGSTGLARPGTTLYVTGVLLLAAFLEEIVVRGYPFQVLAEAGGPTVAVGATAVIFGGLHFANPGVGWTAIVNTILAGILLGILYWKTLSLWFVTGTHVAWNWTMGVAIGLPVSGLDVSGSRDAVRVAGPDILTGGEYGPEGGLLLGFATLIGILWVIRTPRLSRDPAVLALSPLPASRIRRTESSGDAAGASARTEPEAT